MKQHKILFAAVGAVGLLLVGVGLGMAVADATHPTDGAGNDSTDEGTNTTTDDAAVDNTTTPTPDEECTVGEGFHNDTIEVQDSEYGMTPTDCE